MGEGHGVQNLFHLYSLKHVHFMFLNDWEKKWNKRDGENIIWRFVHQVISFQTFQVLRLFSLKWKLTWLKETKVLRVKVLKNHIFQAILFFWGGRGVSVFFKSKNDSVTRIRIYNLFRFLNLELRMTNEAFTLVLYKTIFLGNKIFLIQKLVKTNSLAIFILILILLFKIKFKIRFLCYVNVLYKCNAKFLVQKS